MAPTEYNRDDGEVKGLKNLQGKLLDFLIKELSMRKRIVGRTSLMCTHTGTYYDANNPTHTIYIRQGEDFPPIMVRTSDSRSGGMYFAPTVWTLDKNERPPKSWREYGQAVIVVVVIALVVVVVTLLIRAAWLLPLF